MVTYPHKLFKVEGATAYQDEHGAMVTGGDTTRVKLCKCRYEVDGRGSEIYVGDDKHVKPTGVVYTDTIDLPLEAGALISIQTCNGLKQKFIDMEIVTIDRGRLHNRIWVK